MLKSLLTVLLKVVIILGVAFIINLVIGVIPLPYMDVAQMIVWAVAGLACLWILGVFLISLFPANAP